MKAEFPDNHFKVLSSSKNGTYHIVETILKGSTTLLGELVSVVMAVSSLLSLKSVGGSLLVQPIKFIFDCSIREVLYHHHHLFSTINNWCYNLKRNCIGLDVPPEMKPLHHIPESHWAIFRVIKPIRSSYHSATSCFACNIRLTIDPLGWGIFIMTP